MPTAKYIAMHRIVDRQTVKVEPLGEHTIEFIAKRMYDGYVQLRDGDGKEIVDLQLGVLARVIEVRKDDGEWHEIGPVEFVKPRYEVEPFYDQNIL